jgi:transposase-like protein
MLTAAIPTQYDRPLCPHCKLDMWLVRLKLIDSEWNERTFECESCRRSESVIAKFR